MQKEVACETDRGTDADAERGQSALKIRSVLGRHTHLRRSYFRCCNCCRYCC